MSRLTIALLLLLHVKCDCRNPYATNDNVNDKGIKRTQQKGKEPTDLASLSEALQHGEVIHINQEDEKGNSYLHLAAWQNDLALVNKLLDKGANPNKKIICSKLPYT